MKHKQMKQIVCIATLTLASALASAWADTQSDKAVAGAGTDSCAGAYTALAKMTNSSGAFWITPPANSHTGTFKDASNFGGSYSSVVSVTRKIDQQQFCSSTTNVITFPATNSTYMMVVYVKSATPPPTNGQPMTLQVTWQ